MKIHKTIFSSSSERELFASIHGTWEPEFRVFPQVPFVSIVDVDHHRFAKEQLEFLHKTSVDYVLTTHKWKPLFVIEFDGLGHGLSRRGEYVQTRPSKDQYRSLKLGLKVRIAMEVGLPFIVVSYEEKAVIDPDTGLTVLHGIIGQFLAWRQSSIRARQLYEAEADMIAALPASEQSEYIQDHIMISAEVESEFKLNPIIRRIADLMKECEEYVIIKSQSTSRVEEDPPRPINTFPMEPEFNFLAFQRWYASVRTLASQHWIDTSEGRITGPKVRVRNVDAIGVSPVSLVNVIAELAAWQATLAFVKTRETA